jgi:hypothetical protein
MANDARETCWRCRTDPNTPHPTCPHPAPPSSAAGPTVCTSTPALIFDPAAATRWLRAAHNEHPGTTNAAALGIDEQRFGSGTNGFLDTIDALLAARPAGLVRRVDVQTVLMWRIDDGDVPDQGTVITVDLANGVRLATTHQDITNFADAGLRGIPAAVSALAHIAGQVSALVRTYQRHNPTYQL